VDDVTLEESVDLISAWLAGGRAVQVATVNPEFVMAAQRDAAFRDVLNCAALCVPDGVGLFWGAFVLRQPLRGRVPGVDLVWRLAERCASSGKRVFFLGGFEGVGRSSADKMLLRYPALQVAGCYEGSPADPEALVRVVEARADLVLVAFGAPAQDLWIHKHLAELGAVAIGVGGSFDFIAGRARRAPRWLRKIGLEWLHRLAHEPWRWRRMLVLPVFGWLTLLQRWGFIARS
jgi:N-acetylglucosaminyldiphosphoundecaprenol N-acetyl-beta-D-mannosaminyltransferase